MLNTSQLPNNDTMDMFKKYARLIWKKKFTILLTTILTLIVWILVYTFLISKAAEIQTSAVIRFDDPRSRRITAVAEFSSMSNISKVAVLRSNSFLTKVVDSLKLNVMIKTRGLRRTALFAKIDIRENPKFGLYKISRNKNSFLFYYSNKKKDIDDKLIYETRMNSDSTIYFDQNGLNLIILASVFKEHSSVSFTFVPDRVAINFLKSNINTRLDQSQTLLTVSYSHQDSHFSAEVTNTIARMYINQLLEFNRYQTSAVIVSLEEQLTVARRELEESENELRRFREQNPFVFLANDGQQIVTQLTDYESSKGTLGETIQDLTNLIQRTSNASDFENEQLNFKELLAFLENQNVSSATPFMIQYGQYESEMRRLQTENYSPNHPQIVTLKNRMQDLENQISNLANQYLQSLRSNLSQTEQNIKNFQSDLRQLPRSQLRLAELSRNRQIKENIVSNIMSRYNEAKVSDAAAIPDAFIIDEAQPPLIYSDIINLILVYAFGGFLGLAIGIGLIISLDFFDNTVKSSKEFEAKIKIPVLATIPVIGDEEIPEVIEYKNKMDDKLITSDYAPNIASESFRLLRTKLMMDINQEQMAMVIASMNPNEGKSLVSSNLAITFAQQKLSTILIDCDLRRGVVHHTFACEKKPGLSDILIGSGEITVENISDKIQKTVIPNLFLISDGSQIPNPSELLGSERMKKLINILMNEFKVVLFDTPPIEFIPDALILNNFVHKFVIVARFGKTNLSKLNSKLNEFPNLRSELAGVVINASPEMQENKYSSYSYYHY
jgi:capsular exopolysaccharide synthesis family protein